MESSRSLRLTIQVSKSKRWICFLRPNPSSQKGSSLRMMQSTLITLSRWSSFAITVLPSSVRDESEAEPEPEADVRVQCRLFREEANGLADQAYVQRQVPQV